MRYVGVVNKVNDNLSKEASRMTPAQVALFRAIVRAGGGGGVSPPARQQGRREARQELGVVCLASCADSPFLPSQLLAVCTDCEAATRGLSSLAVLNLPLVAASTELSQLGKSQEGEGTQAGPSSQPAAAAPALRLSASDKESVLAQLVDDGWLFGDSKSSYRLGPRSFLELGRMLMEVAEEDIREVWSAYV